MVLAPVLAQDRREDTVIGAWELQSGGNPRPSG
jgi:hypothetical protein